MQAASFASAPMHGARACGIPCSTLDWISVIRTVASPTLPAVWASLSGLIDPSEIATAMNFIPRATGPQRTSLARTLRYRVWSAGVPPTQQRLTSHAVSAKMIYTTVVIYRVLICHWQIEASAGHSFGDG